MAYYESKRRYNRIYEKNTYKTVCLRIRKEDYKILKEFIDKSGESVNGFFLRVAKEAVNEDVQ